MPDMNNKITKMQIEQRYKEMNLKLSSVEVGDGYEILITEHGGRIFGPFNKDGESVLWVNGVFEDAEKFAKFIEERQWNLGGDRLWIAPELELFCTAPEKFDESYTVQGSMDPGYYKMETEGRKVVLKDQATMEVLAGEGTKSYALKRTIRPAADPLKYVQGISTEKLSFAGYFQDIELKDTAPEKEMYLEPWILTQINPGGKVLVPYLGDFEFVDYYNPVDEKCQKVKENYVELTITGDRKYKTAYRAANTFGRMGYVNRTSDGQLYLMIRNYYNDPSFPYSNGPWKDPEDRGCSMYFYNDDGSVGGFAEFENSCTPIGLDSDLNASVSTTALWFYFGEAEELEKVIRILLGINYKISI